MTAVSFIGAHHYDSILYPARNSDPIKTNFVPGLLVTTETNLQVCYTLYREARVKYQFLF